MYSTVPSFPPADRTAQVGLQVLGLGFFDCLSACSVSALSPEAPEAGAYFILFLGGPSLGAQRLCEMKINIYDMPNSCSIYRITSISPLDSASPHSFKAPRVVCIHLCRNRSTNQHHQTAFHVKAFKP